MQTIRTIIWAIVAAALAVFAAFNFQTVEVAIWPGYQAEMPLAVLIIAVFLLGFLPPYLVHLTNRWSNRRTIAQQERVIADLRTAPQVPATPGPVVHDMAVNPDPITGTVDGSTKP